MGKVKNNTLGLLPIHQLPNFTLTWFTYDTKLKESTCLQEINTAFPINLINPRKAKLSQALKNDLRERLSSGLYAPCQDPGQLGGYEHLRFLFKKVKLISAYLELRSSETMIANGAR